MVNKEKLFLSFQKIKAMIQYILERSGSSMLTVDEKKNNYKKKVWTSFLTSGLFIIFALVLFYKEENIISTSILVVGFIGLIFGILNILKYFKENKENRIYSDHLLQGILMLLFGGVALLKSEELASMLAILIGAYLIYHNAVRLQICMNLDSLSTGHYWKYLAGISMGCIFTGIVILLNPFAETIALSHVIAVCVIISSFVNILQNVAMLVGMRKFDEKSTDQK